jgi:hypothetical protein
MSGHYEHDGTLYWWEPEPDPEEGDLADWPELMDDERTDEEGDDDN